MMALFLLKVFMERNIPRLDWGGFALIEYLLSKKSFTKNFKVLDIGGALGHHSSIMRSFGLSVDLIDKYEKKAEFQEDFNKFNFKKKYDMVFCSHVIEHQRNQGAFLDKIYDILKDNGDLLISGPNHPAEHFVEGHISTTILPVFLQLLIYAGFDCKNGKLMSLGGIENSFIVKKAENYTKDERDETGYKWTDKHQDRAPFKLVNGTSIPRIQLALNNCDIFRACEKDSKLALSFTPPKNYKNKNIKFHLNMWGHFSLLDSDLNFLYSVTPGSPINKEYLLLEI
jgi:2-polyprenyl-3-methyl-5-hydroxy-6-metoxy-1,4-benzoquinol methylase